MSFNNGFLLVGMGSLSTVLIFFVVILVINTYKKIKFKMIYNKTFKEKEDSVKKFKEDGGMHKWIKMTVSTDGFTPIEAHVCEITGYCPTLNGHVPLSKVKETLLQRKIDIEYIEFKKKETQRIRAFYGIHPVDIEPLIDDVLSIKKNFHIKKMEIYKEEVQKQLGKDVKIITNPEELKDLLGKK